MRKPPSKPASGRKRAPAAKSAKAAPEPTAAAAPAPPPPADAPRPNTIRGEHELNLSGTTYRLRPSMTANVAIEEQTGKTLIELALSGQTGRKLRLTEVGVIASEWIKAGATDELTRHVSTERIRELAYEQGLASVIGQLTVCLVDACTGGRKASGEVNADALP